MQTITICIGKDINKAGTFRGGTSAQTFNQSAAATVLTYFEDAERARV
ncbi:hypothetical protein GPUN_0189 [Glaciecola punicea ACAM 611]|uniref:Uncharacterized protein n=1 Tax=Glaciecola punicea ACAM 611 TaxID=1121923 RepID=H5T7R6_9ALTE|nr:hypothetical protein [Glaciecola punicea]GAB54343.1 hypothetical protein GPUN_0189 [Glaciecola punicea ACAM 611]